MRKLISLFMTLSVAFILTTILAFSGVYFTTILFTVTVAEIVTYYGTTYVIEALKKTDSNGNC
ncbi:hypothetical protein [Staphylococcus coagulans]|uniref:hypothetical protein n=1 Tax=Staphylococcus coagulans TaxID=74706 RepID=UPI001C0CFFE7|nr:hypothetical protein [Staphylococcus coagulans]MBU3873826.1 hypothetical protein [Staphylococcus coagulans]